MIDGQFAIRLFDGVVALVTLLGQNRTDFRFKEFGLFRRDGIRTVEPAVHAEEGTDENSRY